MNQSKIQKAKIGVAGSFFNQLMSNNSSIPVVGEGATRMHYTDRSCYNVVEVSKDGKKVKLEDLRATHDKTKEGGMGHQNWVLEPTGNFTIVVWRNNAWRIEGTEIWFTPEFEKECKEKGIEMMGVHLCNNLPEIAKRIYNGEVRPTNVVEGYTMAKKVYSKVNILFGSKDYYYDWSF